MQALIRSKSAGITGGRGTVGAGPGRDLLYVYIYIDVHTCICIYMYMVHLEEVNIQ